MEKNRNRNSIIKKIVLSLIGFAILGLIINRLDFQQTVSYLLGIPPVLLAVVFLCETIEVFWKTLRWRSILCALGMRMKYAELLRLYWIGLFLGIVTPGKIGDFSRGVLCKDDAHSLKPMVSVLIDRVLDVAFLFIIGFLFGFLYTKSKVFLALAVAGVVGTIAFFALLALLHDRRSKTSALLEPLVKFIRMLAGSKDLFKAESEKRFDIGALRGSAVSAAAVFFVLGWVSYFAGWYVLSRALDINIGFYALVGIVSFAGIAAVLPVSIAGIGTRDLIIVYILSLFGIMKEKALAFSLGIFFVNVCVCLIGVFFYMNWAMRPRQNS